MYVCVCVCANFQCIDDFPSSRLPFPPDIPSLSEIFPWLHGIFSMAMNLGESIQATEIQVMKGRLESMIHDTAVTGSK